MTPNWQTEDLTRLLVQQANTVASEIETGGLNVVKKIVAESEVTFGIWQDATQPLGVGCLIIRGESRVRQIARDGTARNLKVGVVPCDCSEQAVAVREALGDGLFH